MSSDESDVDMYDSPDDDSDIWVPEEEESSEDEENTAPSLPNQDRDHRNRQRQPDIDRTYNDPDDGPPEALPQFRPEHPPGLHLPECTTRQDIRQFLTPLSFFKLFFSLEMVQQICANTNTYAQENGDLKPSLYDTWIDMDPDMFYKFCGLLMYMSIVQVPNIELYWSMKALFHGLWARSFMSKKKFKQIQSFLKLSNPNTEREEDKLRKVRFVHNFLRMKCMKYWQPNQCVSIDKRMVQNKGRYSFRQYIKDKPTKWGMKLWVVADSLTGYTYNFEVYTGKDGPRSVFGLAYDVVMSLCKSLFGQGYKIFMDNFYSSFKLFSALWANKTMACGTILTNRRGFPDELKNVKTFNKQADRGGMRWIRRGCIGLVQWKDDKIVNIITTMHKSLTSRIFCKRRTKVNGQFREVNVSQPCVIKDYNEFMGGVDRSDQMIGKYKVLRKTSKYWKTLFYHFLDIARVNAYVLFQEFRRQHENDIAELRRQKKYGQLDFTIELIKELGSIAEDMDVPLFTKKKKEEIQPHHVVPEYTEARRNCHRCYRLFKEQLKSHARCLICQKYFCFKLDRNCLLLDHISS